MTDEVQRSMEKLNDDLLDIECNYLDAVDSVYSIWFEEVDPPDETDIKEKIEKPETYILEIIEYLTSFGYLSKRFHDGVPTTMINSIMNTLNRYGAELYNLYPHGWEKCREKAKESWPERADCFVRVRGETEHWYVFCWEWSD